MLIAFARTRVTSNLHHGRCQSQDDVSKMYSFAKSVRKDHQTRRYSIRNTNPGWEVREEQDSRVIRQKHYYDWHRVERARRIFTIKLDALRQEGWQDV